VYRLQVSPLGRIVIALTARGKALHHLSTHRGITEDPPSSNCDTRPNARDPRWGIRKAQLSGCNGASWGLNTAWCGWWALWALNHAGVKGTSYRQASVNLIHQDALAGKGPFRDWQPRENWRKVLRGDLVTWFNFEHVET